MTRAAVAGWALGLLLSAACAGPSEVATCRVERRAFVREVSAEGHLVARRSTPLTVPQEAEAPMRVEWLVADGARVAAGDPIARFDETGFRADLEQATSERSRAELRRTGQESGARTEAAKGELDAALARREREVAETFRLTDEELFSRNERIESELDRDLALAKEEHALAARDVRSRVAHGAASLIEIERRQAELALGRAETGLAALSLVAPHDGLVILFRDWRGNVARPGDTLYPGQRLAELPDLAEMQAEVYVLEADAGGLEVGAAAEVRLDAHPARVFTARVERVDKVAKPRRRGSPVQYFGATLAVAESDPAVMRPGQRVRARLTLEQRAAALVVPRAALFEVDGRQVVYREGPAGFLPIEVTVESAGAGLVALAGGVAEGDRLALADPRRNGGRATAAAPAAEAPR